MQAVKGLWLFALAICFAPIARVAANDIILQESRMVPTNDLALSDDGKFVATLGMQGQICVWNSSSGILLESLEDQPLSMVTKLSFTPDNRYVSYSNGSYSVVWDWLNRRVVWSHMTAGSAQAVEVDTARGKIHVAEKDSLFQRSLTDGKELTRIPLEDVDIGSISLTDAGKLMILCRKTGFLFVDPDTNQITRRINLEYPQVSWSTPEQIKRNPELANQLRIAGQPIGLMDRSGSRFRMIFATGKPKTDSWFRTFDTDGAPTSEKYPLHLYRATSPWLGETGKMLWWSDRDRVEILDPADPSRKDVLPLVFKGRTVTSIDTDRAGRLIGISTDKGWFCFDGEPGDPQSWKPREFPSISVVANVRHSHRDGKTMLYSSASGAIGSVSLEPGLPYRAIGKMNDEVLRIATFPDGKLMASTDSDHMIFEEGKTPLSKSDGDAHTIWNCHNFILRNAPRAIVGNLKLEVVRSDGEILDSFTHEEQWPEVNPDKAVVLYFSRSTNTARYKLAEITNEGRYRLTHEFEIPEEKGYKAYPESADSVFLFSGDGVLERIDARTKKRTKLRDGVPNNVEEVEVSVGGKFMVVQLRNDPQFVYIPLDPKKPCVTIAKIAPEFPPGLRHLIGLTPNHNGVWFDDYHEMAELPQTYASLCEVASGKLVARLRVYENGGAIVLLPDGRCHFNQEAAGLVMRRKAGETTLSPAESSPDVLKVLAPYCGKP